MQELTHFSFGIRYTFYSGFYSSHECLQLEVDGSNLKPLIKQAHILSAVEVAVLN